MDHLETKGHLTDITQILTEAVNRRSRWNEEASVAILGQIEKSFDSIETDWDDGVPEEWSIFLSNGEVIGILRMDMPLAVVVKGASGAKESIAVLERNEVDTILVENYQEAELSVDSRAIETLLPDWYQNLVGVDEDSPPNEILPFSVARLWWATI